MESVPDVQPATGDHDELPIILGMTLGLVLPTVHVFVGMFFFFSIATRIKAHRDLFRPWLDARYNDSSLRKLFIRFLGILLWEFYFLGLLAYTVHARLFLALSKRRERKQQRNADIELEEARPKDDDGFQSISVIGAPPPYQAR
ncbi:hypothetical protein PG985_008390 [Apiospora marii]|uniref:uncharacterized protein n=1 Tax=Apiospora marii TaxID=335849 RepID=UPI00312FE347